MSEAAVDVSQRPHVVYRLFDAQGHLLYVGTTCNFVQRMWQHAADHKHWWSQVDRARTTVETYLTRDTARKAEAAAIADESPKYNSDAWRPRGRLETDDVLRLAAAQSEVTYAREVFEEVAVEMVRKSSYREVARITGLSTNTLQRWVREAK